MLVADIVDEVILGTDIMNAYGFVVDLRENVLKVGQEKIKLYMAKMTGSTNHSIKRMTLVEEKVNRSGQEEPSLLQAEMEEELEEEIQISVTTKEVIGKPTMVVETKFLLVPELIEAPEGKVAEDEVTQEDDENQTNLDQPVVFRSSVHDATGVIPAKLVVERKTRIPGNAVSYTHLPYMTSMF